MGNQTEDTVYRKSLHEEDDLLIDIGRKLQEAYVPGAPWQIPASVSQQLALLDKLAQRSNRTYSLFDFQRFDFLFCSSNLSALAGDELPGKSSGRWDPSYLSIVRDHKSISDFIAVRNQIVAENDIPPHPLPLSSVGGGTIINLKGQRRRMHYRCTPLVLDSMGNVVLSFDYLEDITSLLTTAPGYWMRFDLEGRIFHWHSDRRKLLAKDILSPREKTLIGLWRQGLSIAEIADHCCVNSQTVKNQLNSARNRLFARDNTALAQLCSLTGLVPPAF